MSNVPLTFKVADQPDELEQIHNLNYETFVEEIPQHSPNEDRALVDKFNDENMYFIAKRGDEVCGMVALRDERPFSLDKKLENLDELLPESHNMCEVRLLAVKQDSRSTRVLIRLLRELMVHCAHMNYDLALISGTTRQLGLYKRIGFEPFGPLVGSEDAPYQPMYLTFDRFRNATLPWVKALSDKSTKTSRDEAP